MSGPKTVWCITWALSEKGDSHGDGRIWRAYLPISFPEDDFGMFHQLLYKAYSNSMGEAQFHVWMYVRTAQYKDKQESEECVINYVKLHSQNSFVT